MLCTSCGFPTSTQDSGSPRAKAAVADRRREQNRRAQQRFRQQDQSHPQNCASNALDDMSPIASSALTPVTPPSTMCTSRRKSSIGRYEESRGDNVIDYDFFLDPNDRCEMNQGTHDFWTSTLKETAPFAATALVLPSELKDCRGHHTTRNRGDSVDNNESGRVPAGPTVLHRAVQTGNSKVVRLLLEHNADCNSKDNAGLTPLMCAVIGGHEEVLELLLSHGAGIGHVDNAHWSALHWAVFHNRHRILERLLSCCGGDASLLNIRNKDRETPLSVAVGAGSEVAVKLLLEFGATVNVE
ncbi:ankyrin repeat-containing domain protein [Penicillium canescens]|nr:ankyrin repeat-containing domain protein [Penicillium canescens]